MQSYVLVSELSAGTMEEPFNIQLPRFQSDQDALLLAAPKVSIVVNRSDHFEVAASSFPSFLLEVSHWRDTSNALGLALGPVGTQVWRALGGWLPLHQLLIITDVEVSPSASFEGT
jgi:hypothetical protein